MTDIRILQTKQRLSDALIALAETVPVSEITTTALCKKADVDRSTFYKYYHVPADILDEKFSEMFLQTAYKYTQPIADPDSYDGFIHRLTDTLTWFYENRSLTLYALEKGGFAGLNAQLQPFLPIMDESPYVFSYLVGGISNLLYRWCKGIDTASPEEMASIIAKEILKTREQEKH